MGPIQYTHCACRHVCCLKGVSFQACIPTAASKQQPDAAAVCRCVLHLWRTCYDNSAAPVTMVVLMTPVSDQIEVPSRQIGVYRHD